MKEKQWLLCKTPKKMLTFNKNASERKWRLFAVACCRRLWDSLTADDRHAVDVAELFADGRASDEDRDAARNSGTQAGPGLLPAPARAAGAATFAHGWSAACYVANHAAAAGLDEQTQCMLIREVFGNPFRPYPAPDHWPSHVIQLANAIYNGDDCGFALADALLEAGHPELADHFRQEQSHPKGCWVVDLVLGRA